jgi:hypothetical protein
MVYIESLDRKKLYLEVIQSATRLEIFPDRNDYYLDIVVRNNSHMGTPDATFIEAYAVYVSLVTP